MALKFDYNVPDGFLKKKRGPILLGHTSLKKIVKTILGWVNVPYTDPCCTDETSGSAPVRFNTETERLEYFNGSDWVGVPDAALAPE